MMKRNGWFVKCATCGKDMYVVPNKIGKGRGKYCSRSCASKVTIFAALKTRNYEKWKESVRKASLERNRRLGEVGHSRWSGDNVGYYGVHDWITKHYGQPRYCEVCKMNDPDRKYHWANLTGKYRRDISDWKRTCVSCHRKYDYAAARANKKLENTQ